MNQLSVVDRQEFAVYRDVVAMRFNKMDSASAVPAIGEGAARIPEAGCLKA